MNGAGPPTVRGDPVADPGQGGPAVQRAEASRSPLGVGDFDRSAQRLGVRAKPLQEGSLLREPVHGETAVQGLDGLEVWGGWGDPAEAENVELAGRPAASRRART